MKVVVPCLILSGFFFSCGEPQPRAGDGKHAMRIELTGVTARQYRSGKRRFEVKAKKLGLDEKREVLEASSGVRGRLEPGLFREGRQ